MPTEIEIHAHNEKVKSNKQGWPIGGYHHSLGAVYKTIGECLAKRVENKFSVKIIVLPLLHAETEFVVLYTERKVIGINKYAEIRAYVDGYRDAMFD